MVDIVPNVVVSMPSQLFTLARSFKAAANGRIYIGKIDTDPTIPENQIQVYLENEDGTHVPIAQPIIINTGGYPVYSGQIAKFVTVQGHSMAVYDAFGVQQFYFPNVLKYDPDLFRPYFDEKMNELYSPQGAYKIGYNSTNVGSELDSLSFVKSTPDLYYGAFFENSGNAVNIVTSSDGVNFSSPTRLTMGNSSPLRGRDPSLCFFQGKWYLAITGNQASVYDLKIFVSDDLISWSENNVKLNGNSAICSTTIPWDTGTLPAKYLWAPELIVDNGELYCVISIYLGYDRTANPSSTANFFGTYASKLLNANNLTFQAPVRISAIDPGSVGVNYYSRIDADIAYDEANKRYIMAAKRENYGLIDVFTSSSFLGQFTFSGTVSMQTQGAATGYLPKSGIEGPALFKMKNGLFALAFDTNDSFDGITYVTSNNAFTTYDTPRKLGMDRLRHGSIKRASEDNINGKGIRDLCNARASIAGNNDVYPLTFIRIDSDSEIIPQSNTVYWVQSTLKITLKLPATVENKDYPRNFYFCVRTNSKDVVLNVEGPVAGGPWAIGWGITNNQIIEFFYESGSSVYRSSLGGSKRFNTPILTAETGTNDINNGSLAWTPTNGSSYRIQNSTGTCTIYDLPDMPVGSYFNIIIESGTSSFVALVLKGRTATNHMGGASDRSYNGGSANDGILLRLEKGSDRWFPSR